MQTKNAGGRVQKGDLMRKQKLTKTQAYVKHRETRRQTQNSRRQNPEHPKKGVKLQETLGDTGKTQELDITLHKPTDKDTEKHRG